MRARKKKSYWYYPHIVVMQAEQLREFEPMSKPNPLHHLAGFPFENLSCWLRKKREFAGDIASIRGVQIPSQH